ncbi:uncharacterized protein LOC143664209 isoform X5 [Tamandua tetradactyla]|uniref:uncharacterized protein LOC143664209 isoform X5 n=1 Tax=Tamandua tetradactyla TaxID=48850 RepID=UPI00405426CF
MASLNWLLSISGLPAPFQNSTFIALTRPVHTRASQGAEALTWQPPAASCRGSLRWLRSPGVVSPPAQRRRVLFAEMPQLLAVQRAEARPCGPRAGHPLPHAVHQACSCSLGPKLPLQKHPRPGDVSTVGLLPELV